MEGRRWFARDVVASMGWWCLIILAIGGCRGVLAVDSATMEPSAAVARGEEGGCYRPLSDVIWGFLVTLLALTVSLWGSVKHTDDSAAVTCVFFCIGVFTPLLDLIQIIECSLRCVSLLWNCHKMKHPDSRITSFSWLKFLCSSLFPWSKSPARILASCNIVVFITRESPLLQQTWLWKFESEVMDESEAMVVGENGARAIRNDQYIRKEFSKQGIGWLVWKEVFCAAEDSKRLPKYDELKYLRGNSGFAVIVIAIQAFGYIYAVVFRGAKNLRTSPLEVIGLIFNIILLMKVFFYSTCNRCHRPLVIYMDRDWEYEIGEFNDNDEEKFELYDSQKLLEVIGFGIFVILSTLLIYYFVHMVKATNVMVGVPVILFLLGLGLELIEVRIMLKHFDMGVLITYIECLLIAVAYIWALIVTVLYWTTMHFNMRGDLINLSQIIPFIG